MVPTTALALLTRSGTSNAPHQGVSLYEPPNLQSKIGEKKRGKKENERRFAKVIKSIDTQKSEGWSGGMETPLYLNDPPFLHTISFCYTLLNFIIFSVCLNNSIV